METGNNPLIVINQTMGLIETRISENRLLRRLSKASGEEMLFLKEQFGEDAVDVGIEIIEAYDILSNVVGRLNG